MCIDITVTRDKAELIPGPCQAVCSAVPHRARAPVTRLVAALLLLLGSGCRHVASDSRRFASLDLVSDQVWGLPGWEGGHTSSVLTESEYSWLCEQKPDALLTCSRTHQVAYVLLLSHVTMNCDGREGPVQLGPPPLVLKSLLALPDENTQASLAEILCWSRGEEDSPLGDLALGALLEVCTLASQRKVRLSPCVPVALFELCSGVREPPGDVSSRALRAFTGISCLATSDDRAMRQLAGELAFMVWQVNQVNRSAADEVLILHALAVMAAFGDVRSLYIVARDLSSLREAEVAIQRTRPDRPSFGTASVLSIIRPALPGLPLAEDAATKWLATKRNGEDELEDALHPRWPEADPRWWD